MQKIFHPQNFFLRLTFYNLIVSLLLFYFIDASRAYVINSSQNDDDDDDDNDENKLRYDNEYINYVIFPIVIVHAIPAWCSILFQLCSGATPNSDVLWGLEYLILYVSIPYLWLNFLYKEYNFLIVFGFFCYFIVTCDFLVNVMISAIQSLFTAPVREINDDTSIHEVQFRSCFFIVGSIVVPISSVFVIFLYFWNLATNDQYFFIVLLITLLLCSCVFMSSDSGGILFVIPSLIFFGYLISRVDGADKNNGLILTSIFVAGFHHFLYIINSRIIMIMIYPLILFTLFFCHHYPSSNYS